MASLGFAGWSLVFLFVFLNIIDCASADARIQTINGSIVLLVSDNSTVSIAHVSDTGVASRPQQIVTQADFTSMQQQYDRTIATLNTTLLAAIFAQSTQIAALSAQVANLSTLLYREISRATSSEISLGTALTTTTNMVLSSANSEVARAVSSESSLALSVSNEVTRATLTENSLAVSSSLISGSISSAVFSEKSRAIIAETSEISRAFSAEASLSASMSAAFSPIYTELSRGAGAETSMTANIAREVSRAVQSESSLYISLSNTIASQVASEASRSTVVDSSLGVSIANEASRAMQVDNSLATSSNTLVSSLSSATSLERSRAVFAETSETSRALSVEASIALSVNAIAGLASAETSRALGAEASLSLGAARQLALINSVNISLSALQLGALVFSGTCRQLLQARPSAVSGLYDITLPGRTYSQKVYCDMTTRGGGWTLIGQTVAAVSAQSDGSGGFRNLFNLRDGGGQFLFAPRGSNTWSIPSSASIARLSTTIMFARWLTPSAGTGDITTADAASYFALPDPLAVTFANPSYLLSGGSTTLTGPCVPVTVTSLNAGSCVAGCTRYTFKFSIGSTWTDTYPTNVGASASSVCYNDVTGGPALASDDSGSYNPNSVGLWGKTTVAGGAPYYWHEGLWDAERTGFSGLGTVWLR